MIKKKELLKREDNELILDEKTIIDFKKAEAAIDKERYEEALDILLYLKKETKNILFDYYIGKVYYKMNKYDVSKIYFKDYEKEGKVLLLECKIYLLINTIKLDDKNENYINTLEDIYKILAYTGNNSDEFNDINYMLNYVNSKRDKIYNLIKIVED